MLRLVLMAVVLLGGSDALAQKCFQPGASMACEMPDDGCSGRRICEAEEDDWGYWGECNYTATSTRPCTGCTSGRQTCSFSSTGELVFGTCKPPTASAETSACDQCDNDRNGVLERTCSQCGGGMQACDGANNPIGTCQPPTASAETCDGCDNNKNGQTDEGLTMACTLGNGCGGLQTCSNGAWSGCWCDGVQRTVSCGQSACGTTKLMMCDSTCSQITACIAEEVCNGCDDDNSGVADDYIICSGQCGP
jgi:hypothetical protein